MNTETPSILILNGSPRKNGNTAKLLAAFKDELAKKTSASEEVPLYYLDFKGCAHCDACKKIKERPACVLKDDFMPILDKIAAADVIVVASPIYCWSVSGATSAALDRFYCLFKREAPSLLKGKKMVGLFTSGGDYFDGMQLCVAMLKELAAYGGAEYVGTVSAINCEEKNWQLPNVESLQQLISSLF